MKTKGVKYGGFTKHKNGQIRFYFWNPITQEEVFSKYVDTEEEAKKEVNKANFDFFSEYSFMLPRGISINRTNKNFMFCIVVRNKTITIKQSTDLDEVMQAKLEFINKLI